MRAVHLYEEVALKGRQEVVYAGLCQSVKQRRYKEVPEVRCDGAIKSLLHFAFSRLQEDSCCYPHVAKNSLPAKHAH